MELISLIKDQSYVRLQDVIYWYVQLLRNRLSREDTWQWLTSNWDWIEQKFKNDKSYDDFPSVTGMILGTDEWLKKYIEFFEPMNSNIALSRAIELGIKDIDSRAKWRERDLTAVREFLMSVSEEERLTVPKP